MCADTGAHTLAWTHRQRQSAPQQMVSVRLRAAVTCAAYFSYFAYTIPEKYAAPEAATTHPFLLLHTLHTFHTCLYIEKEYEEKRAREMDAIHTPPLRPVSSEKSMQSMQSALAAL